MVAEQIKLDDFKLLLSQSYRNYNYDFKFNAPSTKEDKEWIKDDKFLQTYMFDNVKNISMLCKSIGDLAADVEDMKIELHGRENSTGGKFKYKAPITVSFYDVVIGEDNKSNPIFLSDVFKYWIERWNFESPYSGYNNGIQNKVSAEKLYTRRRYRDDNVVDIGINVYSGMLNEITKDEDMVDIINKSTDIDNKTTTQFHLMEKLLKEHEKLSEVTLFNRWKYFWEDKDIQTEEGVFAFSKALSGFGGSSITLHGMINGVVFTILKGLSVGEMFNDLTNDIKKNEFEESAADYMKKSAIAITGSQLYMEKPAMNTDDIINPDPSDLIDKRFNRNKFNEKDFQNELNTLLTSRSLDNKLINQLIDIRHTPKFNQFKSEMESVINKYKFENQIQKDTLKKILGFIGGEESNVKELGNSIELVGNFISQDKLEEYKNKVENRIISSATDFIDPNSINILKEIINKLDQIISSKQFDDPLFNEQYKSLISDVISKLDTLNIKDSFIDVEGLKNYLSKTNFDRDDVGWHIKSRNVITGLFAPATLFIRVLQAKDNLKSLYNIVGIANGWDDFINTDSLPESILMRSSFTIKQFIEGAFQINPNDMFDLLSSEILTSNSAERNSVFNTEELPGKFYDDLSGKYLDKIKEKPSSSKYYHRAGKRRGYKYNQSLRNITLTRAYPTSVILQPGLGNEKIGNESIPVIDITFNFYDIKFGDYN